MSINVQQPSMSLTFEETKRELKICDASLRKAIKRGDIHAVRLGRRIIIPRASLDKFLRGEK